MTRETAPAAGYGGDEELAGSSADGSHDGDDEGPPLKKTLERIHSPVEGTRAPTDDTSSGEVEEVVMPSTTLDLATSKSVADKAATLAKPSAETQEPITSSSAAPMVLGEGYDLSSLLTFDPESIEPAASKASEESGPSATHGQLQHLKALLSSSIETLVEDTEEVKSILENIQPHLPVTLQVKLGVCDSVLGSRVTLARRRIGLRHAQLPLKADMQTSVSGLMRKRQLWTPKLTPLSAC
ncbi:hypothetical protein QYE76_051863 [Lolium multiflorum]|uniref:Uncharacterized protein n=1 Tax=Lolium multiflorum TaxID=4521 RepID=A0AAD8STU8_LOLMU|nr:hypothetical protein QYE76_051863 [Lolium multiflorum]